jgi:hypothetical protein
MISIEDCLQLRNIITPSLGHRNSIYAEPCALAVHPKDANPRRRSTSERRIGFGCSADGSQTMIVPCIDEPWTEQKYGKTPDVMKVTLNVRGGAFRHRY